MVANLILSKILARFEQHTAISNDRDVQKIQYLVNKSTMFIIEGFRCLNRKMCHHKIFFSLLAYVLKKKTTTFVTDRVSMNRKIRDLVKIRTEDRFFF